jgi:uncharacterized Ntn-hydrolase superfamily protein
MAVRQKCDSSEKLTDYPYFEQVDRRAGVWYLAASQRGSFASCRFPLSPVIELLQNQELVVSEKIAKARRRRLRRNMMRRTATAVALVLTAAIESSATWSIIAVDRKSGQVVIASATCVSQDAFARFPAKGLKDIQAIIVPGRGIAAAQANVDRTRRSQNLIATELKRGTEPTQILKLLSEDQYYQTRQYGILDLTGRMAGHTGTQNGKESLDRQGRVDGTEIYFSIQGNILANHDVVEDAVKAFKVTRGNLADRVMAAMEAADLRGGDRRCNCATPPNPPADCDNKTAHVAYIVVANKNDKMGEGLNDGRYKLEIEVSDKEIQPDENDNPVKTLRRRYDRLRREGSKVRGAKKTV